MVLFPKLEVYVLADQLHQRLEESRNSDLVWFIEGLQVENDSRRRFLQDLILWKNGWEYERPCHDFDPEAVRQHWMTTFPTRVMPLLLEKGIVFSSLKGRLLEICGSEEFCELESTGLVFLWSWVMDTLEA